MNPCTYTSTLPIIKAYLRGTIKAYCARQGMTYACAMMRLSRFRKDYPLAYKIMLQKVIPIGR